MPALAGEDRGLRQKPGLNLDRQLEYRLKLILGLGIEGSVQRAGRRELRQLVLRPVSDKPDRPPR